MRKAVGGLGKRRAGPAPGEDVFARAYPETTRVTEHYHYEQEISRNSSTRRSEAPTGEIEIVVPFDGADHFTRQARDDVAAAVRLRSPDEPTTALIGHLLFAGHQQSDLGEQLGLDDTYGALPIRVPITGEGGPSGLDDLSGDRLACVISHDYAPKPGLLEVVPIDVEVGLLDPDTVGDVDELPRGRQGEMDFSKLSQQPNFESFLCLVLQVRLVLPWKEDREPPNPVIDRVALDWPSITSLRALTLHSEGKEVPITYNPVERSIEWRNVPLRAKPSAKGREDELEYVSAPMVLVIEQPGELYQQVSLDGRVEVKIPDYLLSGMRTRLFDGTGRKTERAGREEVSWVSSRIHLILDDAFAKRTLRPHQHLYFDEIIPEDARIADIENALRTRGFTIHFKSSSDSGAKRQWVRTAERSEGPEKLVLTLYVEGTRHETERQIQRGGQTFTTTFPSGELRLFMYGALPRTSGTITREMNALHAVLRDRFARIRSSH
ncbi:hypothetical protein ACIOD2_21790 [Amycolatopsis sp. NPDC088138]|uniref:hypothetical protein n=1 Tax=Amycolatopsis sp. NPDC088138 TaxID=3363938 RepID=UPI0038274272